MVNNVSKEIHDNFIPRPELEPPKSSSSGAGAALGGLLLAGAAVAGGVYLLSKIFGSSDDKKSSTQPPQQISSPPNPAPQIQISQSSKQRQKKNPPINLKVNFQTLKFLFPIQNQILRKLRNYYTNWKMRLYYIMIAEQ